MARGAWSVLSTSRRFWFIHLQSRLAPENARLAQLGTSPSRAAGKPSLRTVARRVLQFLVSRWSPSTPRFPSPWAISRFDRAMSNVVVVGVIPDRIVLLLRCVIIRGMELEMHRLQSQKKASAGHWEPSVSPQTP
ncbi:hypothetical protein MRX96_042399 [Rhipicephalus microplus]